ncbi:MAG: sigma-54-dependent transcriptional regulator [Desulfurivibrionaceae bacterium]
MMSKKKIMLIDDEEVILKSLSRDLGQEGYEIITSTSGGEALEKLAEHCCDLVITDLAMPEMDGIRTLKRIKEISPKTAVIILTGFGDLNSAIDALRVGADDYLLKPCDSDELILRIANCLQKQEALRKINIYEKILPVCCQCGLIRDNSKEGGGKEQWLRGDQFVAKNSDARLSHTYCPECYKKALKKLD